MSLDTMGDFIWKPLVFRLVTSVPGIQPLCGRLPAASRPGLQMLLSRKCVPIARGGVAASAVPPEPGTLFTTARLAPRRGPTSHRGIVGGWQMQKAEPPHGAITPRDAHPGFSEAGNLSSLSLPRN